MTLIDGFNKDCQFHVKCAKKEDGYRWTLTQKSPEDKEFTEVAKADTDDSGTFRVEFEGNAIQYSARDGGMTSSAVIGVKCVMSTKNAMDDTLHSELKIASIDLSTKPPPNEDKEFASVPLEVKWVRQFGCSPFEAYYFRTCQSYALRQRDPIVAHRAS